MALVTMYDAVDASGIPQDAPAVAAYVDGGYAWSEEDWARFPGVPHVTITVLGAAGARVCDCESGDLTPVQAAAWAATEVLAGRRPTIYCNTSTLPAVLGALPVFGLQFGRDLDWWQAQYDGIAALAPVNGVMPVAKQYAGSPGNSPGPYDLSVCEASWLGLVPTTLQGGCDMGTVAVVARPAQLCPAGESVDDIIYVQHGTIYFEANAPYYGPFGAGVPLNAQIEYDGTPLAMEVAAGWTTQGDALRVLAKVPSPDLHSASVYVNACPASKLGPDGFGAWVKLPITVDL